MNIMIDLHTHTFFSDGQLIPSEMVRRAHAAGYKAIGLADHVDSSNIDFVLPRIAKVSEVLNSFWDIIVIPGVEITHAPLEEIPNLVKFARSNGAQIVIVHGQTPAEAVLPGTNRVAIECEVDILAHPGYISREDAELARDKGVHLELSARHIHQEANKHVVDLAEGIGAKLILNTDAHAHTDLITDAQAKKILKSLKLRPERIGRILENSQHLIDRVM